MIQVVENEPMCVLYLSLGSKRPVTLWHSSESTSGVSMMSEPAGMIQVIENEPMWVISLLLKRLLKLRLSPEFIIGLLYRLRIVSD
jgi:hypothetical protein